ncbi:MAG: hypothetical protein FWC00_03410, partial [Firmicutes bacterium]|nr:hypothetical protein [Bacillota bacterium]
KPALKGNPLVEGGEERVARQIAMKGRNIYVQQGKVGDKVGNVNFNSSKFNATQEIIRTSGEQVGL